MSRAEANALPTPGSAETFLLLARDGRTFRSHIPGKLAGNRRLRIYGRLDCPSANRALFRGYAAHRVFFRNENAAISAGYRPCGRCLPEAYRAWKAFSREGPVKTRSLRRDAGKMPPVSGRRSSAIARKETK